MSKPKIPSELPAGVATLARTENVRNCPIPGTSSEDDTMTLTVGPVDAEEARTDQIAADAMIPALPRILLFSHLLPCLRIPAAPGNEAYEDNPEQAECRRL